MDELVIFGGEVKALDDSGKVGGYLVRFTDSAQKDLVGDYFTSETYFGARQGDGCDTLFHHGIPVAKGLEKLADHVFSPLKTTKDEVGIFAETVLNQSDKYEAKVLELVKAGKIGWSSGSSSHLVKREKDGQIKRWIISEGSLTHTPCDPLNRAVPIKSLADLSFDGLDATPPAKAIDGNALFNESLRQTEQQIWELWSALQTGARRIAEGAAASIVTGVEVDTRAALASLVGAFGPRFVDSAAAQIDEWLKSENREEHFYLKSKLDSLIASSDELASGHLLEDHSATVASAVEEFALTGSTLNQTLKSWVERVQRKQEFRANDPLKAGRVISAANKEKMSGVHEQVSSLIEMLTTVQASLSDLLAMAEPKTKSVPFPFQMAIEEHLNWQATRR